MDPLELVQEKPGCPLPSTVLEDTRGHPDALPGPGTLITFEDLLRRPGGLSIDTLGGDATVMTEASMPNPDGPRGYADVEPRFTLLQYVKVRRIRLSPEEMCRAGQVLAARCRDAGIELPKVKERGIWRGTNLYPRSLLADWEGQRQAWDLEWQQARADRRAAQDRS